MIYRSRIFTFDNNYAASLIGSVTIGGDTTILAAVLGFAINDFHEYNTVGVRHRVLVL